MTSGTLKMEAARSSEMLVFYHIAWCHNPEDLDLNLHYCENLKSQQVSEIPYNCNKWHLEV